MEVMGAVERPMMEYSFPTAEGTTLASSNPLLKQTTLKSNRQSFKSFDQVCNSLVYLMRTRINILLTFLRFVLDRKSLYDAWERFKSMLRKCPYHGLPVWRQVQTFYNGVTLANRATIDAAAGGTIMKKLPSEAFNIIDEIATNMYSYGQERADKRTADIHSIDAISALSAQMTAFTHKVDNLGAAMWNGAPIGPCGACGQMGHWSHDYTRFQNQDTRLQSQEASIRNLEVQIGQLVSMVSERREGQLPSDTEKNPKEQMNAITLKNGASINLMPYSIFAKLGMHELTPTIVTLQLADRSIKYPRGIIEDVLVKVGKFVIPVDFVVLDMEEDANTPLILGRPFLATSKALIDVQKGQLTLRINDEEGRIEEHRQALCHLDTGQEVKSKLQKATPLPPIHGHSAPPHARRRRTFREIF
ncbi:UNVERIFIED_CONTAM: hypothetical protein Sradi_0744700 [Sesamum radiatum]|uniref:Retrotransposon gag protein n=1 Tax=Sesamum radiatum TaxID=300843 RepID=A0AAW2VNX7_SESRA